MPGGQLGPLVFPCIPLVGPLTDSVLTVKGGLCGWEETGMLRSIPLFCRGLFLVVMTAWCCHFPLYHLDFFYM